MTNRTETNEIAIAGAGRVAKSLGALLVARGVEISAVAGRRAPRAQGAASFIGVERAVSIRELPRYSRRIVIAVTDSAIPDIAAELADAGLRNGVVLHTSGAAGLEALETLRASGNAVGVLHPLQTVPSAEQGVKSLPGCAYAFAGDREATELASSLIARLDGRPLPIDPRFWPNYHAGAVLACNYQVTLVDAAIELMQTAGIRRDEALAAMAPILRSTLENALASAPEAALTGPIRRGDAGTIRRHMAALEDALPETRSLYVAAGLRTIPIAQRAGLSENVAREVATALVSSSGGSTGGSR